MKFGQVKTVQQYGDDGEVADLELIHENENIGKYKQFKVRHLVHNNTEQTLVYSRFVNDITEKRASGVLTFLKDDPTTQPCFTIKYPKKNIDGSFVVYTSWTERV